MNEDTTECPHGICDGSGYVESTSYDHDSHNYVPDGIEKCLCRLEAEAEDEYDNISQDKQ